ncbi:MAG: UDP-N-acetylmuramoyl-L-alanine--D-glutamate ligase [Deltaproteobacteria bacterium]|nr:UDP-N-acetylmuramoyl-L-alanine--D-glutamate ligase [Deltaproteobacteria bacterium]
MKVAGERFTVVGAGRSGVAASNALAKRGGDVLLVEANAEAARPAGLDERVAYQAGTNDVREGDVAVLSPGVPEVSPVRGQIAARAGEVIGEVELFYRLAPCPTLAITGTDGKSTTTTMLGDIARVVNPGTFVGGNLGNPLCEGLDELTADSLVVAEISCFQLTTCSTFRPRVAIVTNIAEDHLNYHGSFEAYQAAKRRIWAAMEAEDTVILNADDGFIAAWERPAVPQVKTFSLVDTDADAFFADRTLWLRGPDGVASPLMTRDELPLLGGHNVANALAAGLAAATWGIPAAAIREALMAYAPLPHRLATVRTREGVRWVNDSKATNPNAASAGLRAIEGPVILLAGGSAKDADFTAFAALVRERARAVILFGATRDALAAAIGLGGPAVTVVETMAEALEVAQGLAVSGDTVLLSPACASFDQFKSYGHRGDTFTEMVNALP